MLPFLRQADFVTTIAVNRIVLCFSFTAYRRTRMLAFAFWIAGCTICIISSVGLHTYGYSQRLSSEDYRSFMEFYRFGYIVQGVPGCAGSVMLIQHLVRGLGQNGEPNNPLQPRAAGSSGSNVTGNPSTQPPPTRPSGGCG